MFGSRRRRDEAYDNEKAQALIRAVVIGLACLYLLPQIYGGIAPPEARFVAYLVTCHLVFAVALYGWITRNPGSNTPRRVVTFVLDLGGMTYTMAVGGAPFLPLYAIVIRLIVGNGLRYGVTALKASTAAALVSLAITTYCNAYWRANPFLVLTLTAITVLVPTYIYSLLERLRGAYEREQEASMSK